MQVKEFRFSQVNKSAPEFVHLPLAAIATQNKITEALSLIASFLLIPKYYT